MKRLAVLAVVACLCGCALAGSARADYLVNVDFNQNGGPAGTYTGAAVLGSPGDTWNAVGGSGPGDKTPRNGLSLETSSGAASGVTLSFSGQTGFYDATGGGAVFQGTPYQALMDDYVYSFFSQTATVSFSGLTPGGSYRLILYSSSNSPGRDTVFTVDGSSETVADPSGSTTFQYGLNYADFTATADASGNLSFTLRGGQQAEGDLNGIQLQSVASTATPEPASLTLLGIGALGLAGYGWRQRKRAA
jgi:hypothetical protein